MLNPDVLERSIRRAIERHRVLIELPEGESRYRALFEGNPLPMWLQELGGGPIVEVNSAALCFYGFGRQQFLQLDPQRDLLVAAPHAASRHVERHRRGDGSLIDVQVSTHDLTLDGRAMRLVVSESLQELALAQQRLVRREATLHAVLEDSVDGLVVIAADRSLLYLNAAARRLFGPAAIIDAPVPIVGDLAPGGSRELTLSDAQGSERTLELRVSPTDWDGRPAHLLALRDRTDRCAAEQGLQLSRRAMEASANGILIADAADADLPLIYVNPAFERITGYSRGEVLGGNCRFLQGAAGDQPSLQALRESLAQGSDAQVVLRNFRKDGAPFWNELTISPVHDASGAVTHFVGVMNDITERINHEAEAQRRSTHDSLTGLPNRTLLMDRLRQALLLAQRHGRPPTLLFVDIDQFKEINDMLGHDIGDVVLKEIVLRMASCLRESDTLARLGGDELLVLLPDLAQPEDAAVVAKKLLAAVARPYLVEGQTLFCSCSIGVVHAGTAAGDASVLIQQADMAMLAAKRAGRNSFHFYSAELAQRAAERYELRTGLQVALVQREFELHFQPQMDLATQRICAVEALIRWRHPTLGQVAPSRFVPVAEETGQIVAIGAWVLDEACRQHRCWLSTGLLDCPVAVNVSAVQFQRSSFVEEVAATLARHQLTGERLELELTESMAMDASGPSMATLNGLRQLGVRLAIDDFGTGFSNLSLLKRLPIDKVKIDRSFVGDITCDSDNAAITLSVIAIAHHLRLRVVAEGVETAAQLAYLKRHLCDEVQGFLISRPMPAEELERFLADFRPPLAGEDRASAGAATLLLVDDEPNILGALKRTLRRDGYRILTAGGAAEAFALLAENKVHVILSDQRMPQMCGTDFLSQVKSLYPETVRIVLSGYTDLQSVTDAINRGAIYRFLTKPWVDTQLRANIKEAFAHQRRLKGVDA